MNAMPPMVDIAEDFGSDPSAVVRRWMAEIKAYDETFSAWRERSSKIIRRYRDDRDDTGRGSCRMNMLWSNVQTLQPSVYGQTPRPVVSRRHGDEDPVGATAALILERVLSHEIDAGDVDATYQAARDDWLLSGRGVVWERLESVFGPEVAAPADGGSPYRPLLQQSTRTDLVAWTDFGHTPAPRWELVEAVWRCELLTRDQLVKRFGPDIGNAVSLTVEVYIRSDRDREGGFGDIFRRAKVFEIWHRPSGKVFWISPGMESQPLDVRTDFLKIKNFFPCPRPLYATTTTGSLVPVPDFALYQDQANEIDILTHRISLVASALRVAGVYNQNEPAMSGLLPSRDGGAVENRLVPVDKWAAFAERGGLRGSFELLPIDVISEVLARLLAAREAAKRDLYELTGLSDIVRGQAGTPGATATEQRIKGQFATLRLQDKQKEMERFLRDALRIKAEIIAEHFTPETLLAASGVQLPTRDQQIMARLAGATDPRAAAVLDLPSLEDVMELLRSDRMRSWRVDIETDSTIAPDQQADKLAVTELFGAVTQFLQAAGTISASAPEMAPALGEMLLFGVRKFRAGRDVEDSLRKAIRATTDRALQQASSGQDPVAMAEAAATEAEITLKQQVAASEAETRRAAMMAEIQLERDRAAAELALERQKAAAAIALERERAIAAHALATEKAAAETALAAERDEDMETD